MADDLRSSPLFGHLLLSLHATGMHQLGKIASPITGKIERNLEQARATIDLIAVLGDRTRGNLSGDEEKLLKHILYELRLNFVDESAKGETLPGEGAEGR